MRWIYDFGGGSADVRELVGGQGANVAEMTRILGRDRVLARFTITTDACVDYMERSGVFPDGLDEEVEMALARLERQAGKRARSWRME
jgi:pyruvate,orthophosphate dikinase